MRAIRKHLRDFVAIIGLFVIAIGIGGYILTQQRFRIPLLQEKPFRIYADMANAQAVTPGQGQTVSVSGVKIGDIGSVELKDGRAVVGMDIKKHFRGLVHEDAVALLRPRTGLKDMYIQIIPGSNNAPEAKPGFHVKVNNTLPDVNLDEILAGLDQDTRQYVQLLVNGAGTGLNGRGSDLGEVFRRFEPTFRDIALVNRAVGAERVQLRRLVTSLAEINGQLAAHNQDASELVTSAATTFRAFASEDTNLSATVHELPSTLRQATTTLHTVRSFADQLGPTARSLVPAVRALTPANRALTPFAKEATPIIQNQIRPFVRDVRPLVRDLQPAASSLAGATPDLTRSFVVLNHLFNMLGYNQNGREGPNVAGRDEGYLFWLAWVTHQTANLINIDDGNGPLRPVFLTGTCSTLESIVTSQPIFEFALNLTNALAICGFPKTKSVDVKAARADLKAAKVAAGQVKKAVKPKGASAIPLAAAVGGGR